MNKQLGHSDVSTTMIGTRVMDRPGVMPVQSPVAALRMTADPLGWPAARREEWSSHNAVSFQPPAASLQRRKISDVADSFADQRLTVG